ncbi:hypothetical protein ACFYNO_19235 [Kitasatospora sp. NPDC006697]|uniref:hypothetical protein n=1 Tax=Kitasatospora sp. NPDC006697 TaxID=3364020 RepID=UPI003697029C
MARKPRPIDPTEGPLQAFAHDLRLVRERAGNPTYRALATTAGFGATTLSDAAGGVRAPSMEVTLAYVGACGGDTAEWEARWRELNRVLTEQRGTADAQPDPEPEPEPEPTTATATATEQATEPEPEPAPTPAPTPPPAASIPSAIPPAPPRRQWRSRTILAVAAAFALIATLIVTRLGVLDRAQADTSACGPTPPAATATATGSGTAGAQSSDFVGLTYGNGAHVRTGASLNSPTLRTVPPGCRLHFTGFCVGDVVFDQTGHSVDVRWFEVYGGGLVASAIIHGNPPASMTPTSCPDGTPLPSAITLNLGRSSASSDTIQLQATGAHLGIVGFAARYANTPPSPAGTPTAPPEKPTWHQLNLNSSLDHDFSYSWRLGALAANNDPGQEQGQAQGEQQPVTVVAVACLGGDGPTGVIDARTVPAAGDSQPAQPAQPAQLTAEEQTTAEQAACRYPNAG